MFQSQTPPLFSISAVILLLTCCEWLTHTNAYGFGLSRTEVPKSNNEFGAFTSASAAGSVSATGLTSSFAGISQEQIDSQLFGLATGDVVSINNIRYMALRADNHAGQTGRRDMMILVQVEGNDRDSRTGIDSPSIPSDSYASAISHLQAFPSVGINRAGPSYNAPIGNNRQNIIVDEAAESIDVSSDSYSAPYSAANNRQADAVATAFNGGAGVNDPSSLSSYSSTAPMANAANNRQSSAGPDHSSSYPSASNVKLIPTESKQNEWDYTDTIPGVAGQDYPILSKVGASSFSCNGRREGGYYADVESSCQVYHICALDKKFSFLCPNGTLFDQRVFVCQWWFNVDCASSANYYNLNDLIGIAAAPPQIVKNSISFTSYDQPAKSIVSQNQPKQIYGPPSLPVQPVLIGPTIKRPSGGLEPPPIQAAMATSAY